jgi:hypothetical protein
MSTDVLCVSFDAWLGEEYRFGDAAAVLRLGLKGD